MKNMEVKRLLAKAKILAFTLFTASTMTACSFQFGDSQVDIDTNKVEAVLNEGKEEFKEFATSDETKEFVQGVSDRLQETDWQKIADGAKDAVSDLSDDVKEIADAYAKENKEIGDFQKASIIRVVDGDTIVVDIEGDKCNSKEHEKTVRLIGVDTPESVASQEYLDKTGKENTQEGMDASAFTKSYLQNIDYVYLQQDTSDTDRYGRLLRYVWIEVPTDEWDLSEITNDMLQGVLLENHIAQPMTIAPDTMHADDFEQIYEEESEEDLER